jgi:hypothetical protein
MSFGNATGHVSAAFTFPLLVCSRQPMASTSEVQWTVPHGGAKSGTSRTSKGGARSTQQEKSWRKRHHSNCISEMFFIVSKYNSFLLLSAVSFINSLHNTAYVLALLTLYITLRMFKLYMFVCNNCLNQKKNVRYFVYKFFTLILTAGKEDTFIFLNIKKL